MSLYRTERTRCLAEVSASERVRVERILFHVLQDLCYDLGLEEGDVLRCRRASRSFIVLETAGGRTIIMETDWARFIEVSSADEPADPIVFDAMDNEGAEELVRGSSVG